MVDRTDCRPAETIEAAARRGVWSVASHRAEQNQPQAVHEEGEDPSADAFTWASYRDPEEGPAAYAHTLERQLALAGHTPPDQQRTHSEAKLRSRANHPSSGGLGVRRESVQSEREDAVSITVVKTPEEAQKLVVGAAQDVLDGYDELSMETIGTIIHDKDAGRFIHAIDDLDDAIASLWLVVGGYGRG